MGSPSSSRRGRGPCADRGERGWQEHADERARRRAAPDAGTIRIDGRRTARPRRSTRARHGIALIHQELSLCPHMTVAENILMAASPRAGAWSIEPRAYARPRAARRTSAPRAAARPHRRRAADCRAAGRRDLPRARVRRAHPADGRADEQPAARRRGAPVRAHPPLRARGSESYTSATSWRRCAQIADVYTVLRDGRTSRRARSRRPPTNSWSPHGRATGGESVSARAPATRPASGAPLEDLVRRRRARRELRPAPGRSARHRGAHGFRTHRDGAGDLRAGPARGARSCPRVHRGRQSVAAPPRAARRGARVPERGPQGRGPALTMSRRRQHHADALPRRAPRAADRARAAARAGDALDRAHSVSAPARPDAARRHAVRRQPAEGRARRGCCTSTPTSCCSTSRRAASTSAARRRSTRPSPKRPTRARPCCRQLVSAGAVRALRLSRGHEPRPADGAATRRSDWTPESVLHAADRRGGRRLTSSTITRRRNRARLPGARRRASSSRASARSSG